MNSQGSGTVDAVDVYKGTLSHWPVLANDVLGRTILSTYFNDGDIIVMAWHRDKVDEAEKEIVEKLE